MRDRWNRDEYGENFDRDRDNERERIRETGYRSFDRGERSDFDRGRSGMERPDRDDYGYSGWGGARDDRSFGQGSSGSGRDRGFESNRGGGFSGGSYGSSRDYGSSGYRSSGSDRGWPGSSDRYGTQNYGTSGIDRYGSGDYRADYDRSRGTMSDSDRWERDRGMSGNTWRRDENDYDRNRVLGGSSVGSNRFGGYDYDRDRDFDRGSSMRGGIDRDRDFDRDRGEHRGFISRMRDAWRGRDEDEEEWYRNRNR